MYINFPISFTSAFETENFFKLLENIIFVQTSGHNALAPKHWTHKYSAHLFNSAPPPNNERLQPYSGIQEQV